jgi:hypothetical protein
VVGLASTPKIFYRTISDHLRIAATMACGGADDDWGARPWASPGNPFW